MQVKGEGVESEGRQRKMSTRFCALGQDNKCFYIRKYFIIRGGGGICADWRVELTSEIWAITARAYEQSHALDSWVV
jgi:hypothetical protein